MIPICCIVILLSLAVAFFLEEWLPHKSWQYRILERIISILASIPSLIYGFLGIYLLVRHSDSITYLTLTITVVLLIMPYSIQSTQKAIQGVDISVREAVYALGASRWQVITGHVFPYALPMISGGILTAISRVLATAALIIVFCVWKIPIPNSTSPFGIPGIVVALLSSALLLSVLSSLVPKNMNINRIV
ncbi:ABC transporter permease subunit [Candidatus Poribacteria bacterium]|nr:ABC transporter permease subunit [Candidatus Poribacteria bacterium]